MHHFESVFYGAAPPFVEKERGEEQKSSADFENIVLRPRPAGKIPSSSAWHLRHEHDAPSTKSLHLKVCTANPPTELS